MLKVIKLKTSDLSKAAKAAGTSPEKFVSDIRSKSLGREVCAHLLRKEGAYSVFRGQGLCAHHLAKEEE